MKNYLITLLICFLSIQTPFYLNGDETASTATSDAVDKENPSNPYLIEPYDQSKVKNMPESDFEGKFMQMIWFLGGIIAFMLLASWFVKKMSRNRIEQLNAQSSIKVLESRVLSTRSSIYLLEIMGKGILVAESHSGINMISIPLEKDEI